MSMMSENMLPSACEVDVTGTLSMYAMQLASGSPSVLVDWNNNYGDDPDKGVVFHCSNLPKDIFRQEASSRPTMEYQEINAGIDDPGVRKRLVDLGNVPTKMSPAEDGKLIAVENDKWGKVIKFAGIKLD